VSSFFLTASDDSAHPEIDELDSASHDHLLGFDYEPLRLKECACSNTHFAVHPAYSGSDRLFYQRLHHRLTDALPLMIGVNVELVDVTIRSNVCESHRLPRVFGNDDEPINHTIRPAW